MIIYINPCKKRGFFYGLISHKMKRNFILFVKLLVNWIGLTFWTTFLTVMMFPYQVFRAVAPKPRPGRPYSGNRLSRWFRQAFEHKQTRKFIGAGLTVIMMFFGLMGNVLATTSDEAEPTLIEIPETEVLTKTSLNKPLGGVIGQGYHGFHRAIDILAPVGSEIRPIASGKVVEVSLGRLGWGHTVVIDHGDNLRSRYAHLKEIKAIKGEKINESYVLGTVGMTGWTTGPHLHLEVYQDGTAINPLTVLPNFDQVRMASNN